MRTKKEQLVITFSSTPEAIKMEKYCQEHQLPGRLIPTPAQITAGCGLAWKTDSQTKEKWVEELNQAKIAWEKMQIIEL